MPANDIPFIIRDFRGVNRRDGAERMQDNEAYSLQNFFHKEKGILDKCYGSTDDLVAADIPGADRINAIHRHPSHPAPKARIYHCTPTSTAIAEAPGTGLTITEVTSATGTMFAAANPASRQVRFCFSYVGMGVESTWDTRLRAGFSTALPVNAWNQPGLQSFSLASTTNTLEVSHPTAFPTGVRSVNVFMSIGSAADLLAERRELAYVGTLFSNSDVLAVDVSIGTSLALSDIPAVADMVVSGSFNASGALPQGQYYIALGCVAEGPAFEAPQGSNFSTINRGKVVSLSGTQNRISVSFSTGTGLTTNGASHVYVFIGVKPPYEAPMTCVGTLRISSGGTTYTKTIDSLPVNSNAQTRQYDYGAGPAGATFRVDPNMSASRNQGRHGFLVKRDTDRTPAIAEILPSRSEALLSSVDYLYLRTQQDRMFNNAAASGSLAPPSYLVDPVFNYFFGLSYLVNGDRWVVTDGYGMCTMRAKENCVIPGNLKSLMTFKSQLVGIDAITENLVYGSNALQPNNWSDGGTGTALKFVTAGDPQDGKLAALGLFAYNSGEDGPRTFLVATKKFSVWVTSSIPDIVSGINGAMEQASGKIGCSATRTMCQSKIGTLFLGSDGDVYLMRSATGEPYPVGGRIKPLLSHLVADADLMQKCVAVIHGDFYKLCYPSSASSTYNDAQLWGDIRTEDGVPISWDGPHTGIAIGAQCVMGADGDSGERIVALADAVGSAVADDESTNAYQGTAMVSVFESKLFRGRAEMNFKRVMGLLAECNFSRLYDHTILIELFADRSYTQKTITISADADYGEAFWETLTFMVGDSNLSGRAFKFRITHTGSRPFTIASVGLPYKPERRQIT